MSEGSVGISSGPYVTMATFCEYALQEKDDAITAVRIVDRVALAGDAVEQLEQQDIPTTVQLWAVIMLQPGGMRGAHTLTLRPTTPIGGRPEPLTLPILFPEDGRGVQVVINLNIAVTHEGTTNFEVYVDEQFLTRIPLSVAFMRQPNTGAAE